MDYGIFYMKQHPSEDKKKDTSLAWWPTPLITTFGRQLDLCEFKVSQGHAVCLCLKTKTTKPRKDRRNAYRNDGTGYTTIPSMWSLVAMEEVSPLLKVHHAYLSCPDNLPLRLSYMLQILCFLSSTRAGRSSSRLRRQRLS